MRFPQPVKLSSVVTRWRISELERYEAECGGTPAPEPREASAELYLSVRQVAARYSTTPTTIWRWVAASRGAA